MATFYYPLQDAFPARTWAARISMAAFANAHWDILSRWQGFWLYTKGPLLTLMSRTRSLAPKPRRGDMTNGASFLLRLRAPLEVGP
jgi:hypothetical protein